MCAQRLSIRWTLPFQPSSYKALFCRNYSTSLYAAVAISLACCRTLLSYAAASFWNMVNASLCAGSCGLGSLSKSWIPNKICLMVIAGFQPLSSSKMLRQTVPDGKTFGWNSGGVNLHLGGLLGYSSGKIMRSLYRPPSHGVCCQKARRENESVSRTSRICADTSRHGVSLSDLRWPCQECRLPSS